MKHKEQIEDRLKDLKELLDYQIKSGESTWEIRIKISMLRWVLDNY